MLESRAPEIPTEIQTEIVSTDETPLVPHTEEERQYTANMWLYSVFLSFIPSAICYFTAKPHQSLLKRQSALALTITGLALILGIVIEPLTGLRGAGGWLGVIFCIQGHLATKKDRDFSPPFVTELSQRLFKR